MVRDNNTFAKRQREIRKKEKAQEKKVRRRKRRESANGMHDLSSEDRPAGEQ